MKTTSLFLLPLIFIFSWAGNLAAQEVVWSKHFASNQHDGIWDVKTDSEGNVLVLGFHWAPIEVDGQTLSHGDETDFFLVKMDADGVVLWAQSFTGPGFDRGNSLAVDDADHIYVGGLFSTNVTIADSLHEGVDAQDVLIFKLDPSGALVWSKIFGGNQSDICYGLHWEDDQLLAVGHFRDTMQMGGEELISNGDQDMWLARLSPTDGSVNWAVSYGSPGRERLYRVTTGPGGDIYACGYYEQSFQMGNLSVSEAQGTDAIAIKWSSAGEPLWVATGQGPGQYDEANDLVVDAADNLYVAGYFYDSAYFNLTQVVGGENTDGFLASYDGAGALRWARASQTSGYSGNYGLALSEDQQMVFAGGNLSNGNGMGGEELADLVEECISLTAFDTEGTWLQTLLYDGPGGDYSSSLVEADGEIILGAAFEGSIMLDPGVSYQGAGFLDVLLVRVKPEDWSIVSVSDRQQVAMPEIYWDMEGAELLISLPEQEGTGFIWSADGKMVEERNLTDQYAWSLEGLPSGVYYVSVQAKGRMFTKFIFIP